MEYNKELELLKKQLKDNIIDWYPMEDNAQYVIMRDFCKRDVDKLKEAVENEDYETIRKNIYDIWERQIFCDGNTRTILCFLKIMKEKYNINVNYDFKKDINKDNFIRELVDSIYKEKIK